MYGSQRFRENTCTPQSYHRAELVGVHDLGATQAAQADHATMEEKYDVDQHIPRFHWDSLGAPRGTRGFPAHIRHTYST